MQATVFSSLLTQSSTPLRQRGGLFLGLIIGVLVGLGAALVVALYVAKVPVPFMNKSATKTSAEQDAAEQQKNKDWDPNAPLYGKTPAKPAASGTVGTLTAATSAVTPPAPSVSAPKTAASAPKATSADPLGDLAKAKASGVNANANANANSVPAPAPAVAGVDPFTYFVQAGAFRTPEDAQAQKAKLSMAGFQANVTEREQSGRTVFRVRVGPLDKKEDADKAKERLDGAGFETAIVRVQR